MPGETICDLLRPLIGKSGSIVIAIRKIGPIGLAVAEHNKLTSVEVRPDGLIHIERETGWTVVDPDDGGRRGLEREPGAHRRPVPLSSGLPNRSFCLFYKR